MSTASKKLEKVVAHLADERKWSATRMISERDAADYVLAKLAQEGLIEHRKHRWGGNIWTINGKKFGRTDAE